MKSGNTPIADVYAIKAYQGFMYKEMARKLGNIYLTQGRAPQVSDLL